MTRRTTWLMAAVVGVAPSALVAQAATGTITGQVTDRASGRPVPAAQVQIVGTTRGAATNDNGAFRIVGVAPGSVQVRVLRIGFQAQTATVQVAAGQTANVTVAPTATATTLDQVVVTATGEQIRRREQGTVVSTITPNPEQLAAAANITDVLNSRAPSVYVQQAAGVSGTGSRIRIRGANSLSLTNEPLLVIDGIRANNDVGNRGVAGAGVGTNVGTGGQVIGRLNDINPEDIENIEIIKGPAGVALYGTAAANGVIQITTKRGRAGATRFNGYGEAGALQQTVDLPSNFANVGRNAANTANVQCTNDAFTRGTCTQGTLRSLSPQNVDDPFRFGNRFASGFGASGGSDRATFYVNADVQGEKGVQRSNRDDRYNLRANLTGQLTPDWNVQVTTSYLSDRLGLPVNDNSTLGQLSVALLGRVFAADSLSGGFFNNYTPTNLSNLQVRQRTNRFIPTVSSTYQAAGWLSFTGNAGLDYINQTTSQVILPNRVFFADLAQGSVNSNPQEIYTYTAQGNAIANFKPASWLTSTTTVGTQYTRETFRGTNAFGAVLAPGTGSLSGTSQRFGVSAFNLDNVTVGVLANQRLGYNDRLFLNLGFRSDRNSATGQNFGFVFQPTASLSYVLSDEPFFPKNRFLTSVQLRSAYGVSTQRPRFTDAITFLQASAVRVDDQERAAITFTGGSLGDPDLRPEKSGEFEGGFDLGFGSGRVNVQVSYYDKRTRDLLVLAPVAPSVGAAAAQFRNLGLMRNSGVEYQLNANLLDTKPAKLELGFSGNTNANRLIRTGLPAPIQITTQQQHRDGYPAGGFWQRPYRYNDANGDRIIARSEVTFLSDTALYLGNPLPRQEFQVQPALTLYGQLRVSALVSRRSGYKVLNSTNRFRCVFSQACQDVNDPTTPLDLQARAIAAALNSDAGYIESGAFTRLRELAFAYTVPERFLPRTRGVRATGLTLTVAGRNLATWTKYTGLDPEITSTPGSNFASSDFLTVPPVRAWVTRLSFNF